MSHDKSKHSIIIVLFIALMFGHSKDRNVGIFLCVFIDFYELLITYIVVCLMHCCMFNTLLYVFSLQIICAVYHQE